MAKLTQKNNLNPFESPEVRVVEASAGSGKTFALAKRYVQLLIHSSNAPVHLRSILAITFTNKSAVEMKARILDFLKKIALGRLSELEKKEILIPLNITEQEACGRAYAVMEGLIRNYNFFQVQTIDSFINALLCGCSFKINLSANFNIKRNSHEYIAGALDALIDRAATDKDIMQALNQFLHQYLFIENRSGWFPKKDLLKILIALFNQSNFYSLDFLSGPAQPQDLFMLKKEILKLMRELKDVLPENTHATFQNKFQEFLKNHDDAFDVDDLSEFFNREEFPSTKGLAIGKEVEKLWEKIHRGLRELSELEASTLFNSYIDVFAMVIREFRAQAVKDDVLFLEELNKKARSLFDDGQVTVEELYYRLATRFHHYMMDEFQDTSRLQWENLTLMVQEALSTGGSLFYVGDKKQAIYGFRGGDSLLFDDLKTRFASYNVRQEFLEINWRSRKNIVDFNNQIFSMDNLKRFIAAKEDYERQKKKKNMVTFSPDDLNYIQGVFANSQQKSRDGLAGGFVHVEPIEADKKEERDEEVRLKTLELIQALKNRYALSEIAILTRNNSDVEAMTGWLLEAGIDVHSERTSNIKNNKTIREIEALLRFLGSPIDNVSFANFILGETFAKASGRDTSVFHDFVFELRPRISRDKTFYIYKEFRQRFTDLWEEFFEDFFKNVGLYPLYEFTVSLLERLNIIENFPSDRGFVMHFLGVIKNQEKERGDLTSFLKYFEEPFAEDLFVFVRGQQAVRILTIHKAKGLEFPVVILPSLEMDIKVGSGGKDGQQSFVAVHAPEGIRLVRLKEKYRALSPALNRLYAHEYKHSFLTELNNVYVALTRAISELYVFIPSRAGQGTNPAQFLISENLYHIGDPVVEKRQPQTGAVRSPCKPVLSRDWMSFLKEEFSDIDLELSQVRQQGEMVHGALSFISDLNAVSLTECWNRAKIFLMHQYPSFTDWESLRTVVVKLVDAPRLKPFFYLEGKEVYCEREIVDARGETKRIDRMIVSDDGVDIVDFKTSREARDAHTVQVRQYIKLAAGLYPSKTIRGWIIYFHDQSVEKVEL